MEDTIDNCVHIKTEPADEEFEPQNTGQDCGQYSEREPVLSIETQNCGDFSSNVGYIKTESSEQNFHHVDRIDMNEKEDCPDLDVAKIKSESDEELALKDEPDSSPYTSQPEDDVGLFLDRDAGHWAPTTQGDGVGLPSDGDASHWEELKLKDEPISPPRPVQESLIPATGNRGLLRIDVEDPLHPVQSGIVKQEPEEEVELDDQKALNFDVANVKHEPLSASCTGQLKSSCEAGGKNIVAETSLDLKSLQDLNSSSTKKQMKVTPKGQERTQTKVKQFKCDQCDEAFACFVKYKMHRKRHQQGIKCHSCDKIFQCRSKCIQHEGIHTGERPFKCDQCDKTFTWQSALTVHKRNHTGEGLFACSQCGLTFACDTDLTDHQRIVSTGKTFKCNKCDKTYRLWNELTMHLSSHAGETMFKCNFCNKTFANESDLTEHKHVHKGDREKPFACELCGKAFNMRGALTAHRRIHTGEKPFKCDLCFKAFNQKNILTEHRRIHTGEKPYKCDLCHKAYMGKGHLRRHTLDKHTCD
ncbi:zinc finger protein 391-like isoform X2 [Lineus longissimus]|uniref:zinc finger protein 391-like isoform X2 n=1 Tax=Lineus longissimus TaxID=88925 RepID=UPI002B4E6765